MTEGYLALASHVTTTAGHEVHHLRVTIDALRNQVAALTPETRAEIISQVRTTVTDQLGPAISTMRTTFTTVRTSIIAMNRSLESANRIPSVNVPTFTDALQAVEQRLAAISDNLTALTAAVADVQVDTSQIETLLSSTSDQLASVEGCSLSGKLRSPPSVRGSRPLAPRRQTRLTGSV